MSEMHSAPPLKRALFGLYFGRSAWAVRFRYALLAFDIVTVLYFVVVSMIHQAAWMGTLDMVIALVLVLDYGARFWLSTHRLKLLRNPITIADAVVLASLVIPAMTENFAFLRVARALRLVRSHHVLKDLRRFSFIARNEQLIQSVINLVVFIFVVTALVYVLQVKTNPAIANYVDALYFTVATLTTTGFGDITLTGSLGRILAVIIMVFGISLFLRLVQTIFVAQKRHYVCPSCGLSRHDPDAIHCKHCGETMHIETEGQ